MRLSGKVALVTGSASGIGEAIARRFAAEGARVMIHDRDVAAGQAVAKSLCQGGTDAKFFAAELSDPGACTASMGAVVSGFGAIHILVNNAALSTRSTLETTDAALFDYLMAVNVRAPMLLIQAALPHFRRNSGGAVLNIGSVNGYGGQSDLFAYSVTKGALMTLTRNLADALGKERVRVNQINPGWVVTPNEHRRKLDDGLGADWAQKVDPMYAPFGRLMTPDEIAYWAVNFCSDENVMVSGSVCDVEQFPLVGRNPVK